MNNSITNLWIIKNGILLYEHNEIKKDSDIIGSFLSVIDIYIEKFFNENLSIIRFRDRNIYFEHKGDLLFILTTNKNCRERIARDKLKLIINRFFKVYDLSIIHEMMGNQTYFKNFKNNVAVMHSL
jgi:hypothetical protein